MPDSGLRSLKNAGIAAPLLWCLAAGAVAAQSFVEVAETVGLELAHALADACNELPLGSGSAWADIDNDGDLDLFVTQHGGANHLYRNDGDLNGDDLPDFTDVAADLGLEDSSGVGHGAVFVDFDNDGDQDLHVTSWGRSNLYRNLLSDEGTLEFVDVTAGAGIEDDGRVITAAWGDFDADGYLDLYLGKHRWCNAEPRNADVLFHSNGAGADGSVTFTDVTDWLCPEAACDPIALGLAFAPGWLDVDNDGDLDLYVVNDDIGGVQHPNVLWRNDGADGAGGWLFTDVSAASGTDVSLNGMGLAVGDVDNDGWLDLAFSNIGPNYLLSNDGALDAGVVTFTDISASAGIQRTVFPGTLLASITWGTVFFDHDNDGLPDLLIVAGSPAAASCPNAFFVNNGDGTFTDVSDDSGLGDPLQARNASIADFDQDGFVDVFVGNYGDPPRFFHNQGNDSHWLTVTVEGTRSNRDGIGTRVYLTTADGVTQMREISSGPTHGGGDHRAAYFGLGEHATGELAVRWPTGTEEVLGTVSADQGLHLVEPPCVSEPTGCVFADDFESGNLAAWAANAGGSL